VSTCGAAWAGRDQGVHFMLMLSLYCKAKALLASRDRGATATEYALLIALVGVALAVTIGLFNGVLGAAFDRTCTALEDGNGTAGC
jgi:pilus assembly protein Flp/PilA